MRSFWAEALCFSVGIRLGRLLSCFAGGRLGSELVGFVALLFMTVTAGRTFQFRMFNPSERPEALNSSKPLKVKGF